MKQGIMICSIENCAKQWEESNVGEPVRGAASVLRTQSNERGYTGNKITSGFRVFKSAQHVKDRVNLRAARTAYLSLAVTIGRRL